MFTQQVHLQGVDWFHNPVVRWLLEIQLPWQETRFQGQHLQCIFTCGRHLLFFSGLLQRWWSRLQPLVMRWLRCPLTPSCSLCRLWERAWPPALQTPSTRSVKGRLALTSTLQASCSPAQTPPPATEEIDEVQW